MRTIVFRKDQSAPKTLLKRETGRFSFTGPSRRDPWAARDDYVTVRSDPASRFDYLARHQRRELTEEERSRLLQLLEMQRQALCMYTSCGWFFDELSGIETVQVMAYAARAIQLATAVFDDQDLEERFLVRLEEAPSNRRTHANGRDVYDRRVRPQLVDPKKVAAHYAIRSIFEPYAEEASVFCYDVSRVDATRRASGRTALVLGQVRVTTRPTLERALLTYGVLHMGDHVLHGGVREFRGEEAYAAVLEETAAAFERGDFPAVIGAIDANFGGSTYSLRSLFRDEQRRLVDVMLRSTLEIVEATYARILEDNGPLMRFLHDVEIPLPRALRPAAGFQLVGDLLEAIEEDPLPEERIRERLAEAAEEGVELAKTDLVFRLEARIEQDADLWYERPEDAVALERLDGAVRLIEETSLAVDLHRTQNHCVAVASGLHLEMRERAASGDAAGRRVGRALRPDVPSAPGPRAGGRRVARPPAGRGRHTRIHAPITITPL